MELNWQTKSWLYSSQAKNISNSTVRAKFKSKLLGKARLVTCLSTLKSSHQPSTSFHNFAHNSRNKNLKTQIWLMKLNLKSNPSMTVSTYENCLTIREESGRHLTLWLWILLSKKPHLFKKYLKRFSPNCNSSTFWVHWKVSIIWTYHWTLQALQRWTSMKNFEFSEKWSIRSKLGWYQLSKAKSLMRYFWDIF